MAGQQRAIQTYRWGEGHYIRHKNKDIRILFAVSGISLEKLYKESTKSNKVNDSRETFT
jgi:hypothetical protein